MEMKTMVQIQKQKVQLTTLLREKLRDLRKTYNKRGDVLSKELDRGASYISQLEKDFTILFQISSSIQLT